jgi:hypothetical protein
MKILNNFPNKFERPEDLVDFNNLPLLMNEQVQGFVDAESCFFVNVRKNSKSSSGTRVELQFSVKQERSNISTLFALNNFFGKGHVRWANKAHTAAAASQKTFLKLIPLLP